LHAALVRCLNYGGEKPQVVMIGGVEEDENTLIDVWIFDVTSGVWKEVRFYKTCNLVNR